jgi:hypothetical protein
MNNIEEKFNFHHQDQDRDDRDRRRHMCPVRACVCECMCESGVVMNKIMLARSGPSAPRDMKYAIGHTYLKEIFERDHRSADKAMPF